MKEREREIGERIKVCYKKDKIHGAICSQIFNKTKCRKNDIDTERSNGGRRKRTKQKERKNRKTIPE